MQDYTNKQVVIKNFLTSTQNQIMDILNCTNFQQIKYYQHEITKSIRMAIITVIFPIFILN